MRFVKNKNQLKTGIKTLKYNATLYQRFFYLYCSGCPFGFRERETGPNVTCCGALKLFIFYCSS